MEKFEVYDSTQTVQDSSLLDLTYGQARAEMDRRANAYAKTHPTLIQGWQGGRDDYETYFRSRHSNRVSAKFSINSYDCED